MSPLHKLGQMRDKPSEGYRPILTLYPLDVAERLDRHIQAGGLGDTADARDQVLIEFARAGLDRAERRGPTAAS